MEDVWWLRRVARTGWADAWLSQDEACAARSLAWGDVTPRPSSTHEPNPADRSAQGQSALSSKHSDPALPQAIRREGLEQFVERTGEYRVLESTRAELSVGPDAQIGPCQRGPAAF
jgi:hypothetical protein